MKIHKIELENIHSLKGYHCIDFNNPQLKNSGIFAIIGPTGSGKSTILDVITLALFKQIARFKEKISTSNIILAGTVMTRGTERAFASVEYENSGKFYRSKFNIFKRAKNFAMEMEIADLQSNEIIETGLEKVPETNESIIGLNYQQFIKSIILPQGGFANFLKATTSERATFLEKITGTEIFRTIGKRAFEINKLYEEAIKTQFQIVETFNTLSEEQIQHTQNTINELNEELSSLELLFSFVNEAINSKKTWISISKAISEQEILIKAQKNKLIEFQPQTEKLNIHKKILPFKTDFFIVDDITNKISELKKETEILTKKISENQQKIELLINYENIENQKNNDLSNSLQQAKTNQIDANRLKTEFVLIQQKYIDIQNINKQICSEIEKNENEFKNEKKNFEKLTVQKTEIQNWIQENTVLSSLNKDIEGIKIASDVYETSKNQTQNTILKSNLNIIFQNILWKDYHEITKNEIEKNSIEIEKINKKLTETIESSQIATKSREFSEKISVLKDLLNISELYSQYQNTYKKNEQKINELEKEIIEFEIKITEITLNINQFEKDLNELRSKREFESQLIKYENDRENLKHQQPCPLCGSFEHPFVKSYIKPNTKNTISLIDKKEKELKTAYINLKEIEKLLEVKKHQKQSFLQENEILIKNQKTLQKNFEHLKIKHYTNFEITNISIIQTLLEQSEKEYLKFQENISLQTQFNELSNKQNQLNSILSLIQTTINHHTNLKNKILPYNTYTKGISSILQIIENLIAFSEKFQQNIQKLNEIDKRIELFEQKNNIFKFNIQQLKDKENEIQNQYNAIKRNFENIQQKYNQYLNDNFQGYEPQIFIQKIEKNIDENRTNITKIQNNTTELKTQTTQYEQINKEKNKKIEELTRKLNNLCSELEQKIAKLGFASIDNAKNQILEENLAVEIETKQNEIQTEIQRINEKLNTFTEQKNQLEKSIKSEKDLYELEEQKNEIENKIKTQNQELGSLKEKLSNNNKQIDFKQKEIQKLEQMQNEHIRWEKLKNTIGDKEGKIFNEIAQKITLNELLRLANIHLSEFNNRYILDYLEDNRNDLFICDKYLGYSIRSVQTLSGGETFVLSLSLALALSDLASQNVRIQTLFIDEGFATLDEEALDAALRYLEKLNTQYNRTIGIISHVIQIKERIVSKIVLNKSQNGFSTIEFE